jgi:hypothetical protein
MISAPVMQTKIYGSAMRVQRRSLTGRAFRDDDFESGRAGDGRIAALRLLLGGASSEQTLRAAINVASGNPMFCL